MGRVDLTIAETVNAGGPILRLATLEDADSIEALMKVSTRDLFPIFYGPEQTASSIRFVAHVDLTLIEDGTYFVVEAADELFVRTGHDAGLAHASSRPARPRPGARGTARSR